MMNLDVFQLQDLSQPKSEAYAPDGALEVPLLRHQVQNLAHDIDFLHTII